MSVEEIILICRFSERCGRRELIKKAYDFSLKAHGRADQKIRRAVLQSLYETVKILRRIENGRAEPSAGFLHDAIEDGVATEETIRNEFGDEILFLVNGVTKLGKVRYKGAEKHLKSLRKFLVATAQDIRVLIIKLADRLHNMRTLEFVERDEQKRIALETLEIYAPLADRLSIRMLSRELEDLSFKYIHPKEYEETAKPIKPKKKIQAGA